MNVRSISSAQRAAACAAFALLASASPAFADEIEPPKVYTTSPGGVNMSDGSFTYTSKDLSIGTLTLERFHLGGLRDPNTPFFGPRLSHNFDIYVDQKFAAAQPPFFAQRYKPMVMMGLSASGVYGRPYTTPSNVITRSNKEAFSGELSILASGAYQYIDQQGVIYTFDPAVPATGAQTTGSQRVKTITYPIGRVLTFTYSGSQLKTVSDNSGYALVFEGFPVTAACGFNLAVTYVTAATTCPSAPVKTAYGYTSGKLTSFTDPAGNTTTYAHADKGLSCIKPPGYSTCKISNTYGTGSPGADWQVVQQTFSDTTVLNYSPNPKAVQSRDPGVVPETYEPDGGSSYTDANGKTWSYQFVKSSPYIMVDPLSRGTEYRFTGSRDFEWDVAPEPPPADLHVGSMLIEAILPEGNKYLAEYNGQWNTLTKQTLVAKLGSDLADRVITYGYDCSAGRTKTQCVQPIWVKDARSNAAGGTYQSDFAYASHGGLLSEMKPAPSTGAARPVKLATWAQKYAYVKNSSGSLVPAASPIWMIASETQCQTVVGGTTPVCDGAATQTITTYQYGADGTADNLLVRGVEVSSGGTTLRICYGYDALGNRIWETKPKGSCS